MGKVMEYKIQKLYDQVNQAIIRCRGVYSMWAKNNNVSYNRMLVLYTIREFGFCTQKQICDSYLLPRQTVNHVISEMKKDATKSNFDLDGKGKLGEENEDDCDL